jgi:hypothetical protein
LHALLLLYLVEENLSSEEIPNKEELPIPLAASTAVAGQFLQKVPNVAVYIY